MINLLPQHALREVKREYWVRVLSVWTLLLSFGFLLGSLQLLPTYVLLDSQVDAYQTSAAKVENEVKNYEDVSTALLTANQQATALVTETNLESFSELIEFFTTFESSEINISSIELARDETTLNLVRIEGTALDRQSLAAFRDELLATPEVALVDLPISNLARDENIPFTIAVTLITAKDTSV